jgi:hypothetical protein
MLGQTSIMERKKNRKKSGKLVIPIKLLFLVLSVTLTTIVVCSIRLMNNNNNNNNQRVDMSKSESNGKNEGTVLSYSPKRRRSIIDATIKQKNNDRKHINPLMTKSENQLRSGRNNIPSSPSGSRYPPLKNLLHGEYNVTGDVSFILDFAIIGFPKCGTSTMMEYLDQSPYTKVAQKERCDLGYGRQAKLVRDLYAELPEGEYQRGIKCPRDLENEFAMHAYTKYFPTVNFLVGLRHPVLWFESFYNFRVYNNNPMPPADQLVGSCTKYSRHVCTHRARFHQFLANLGKTSLSPDELKYFKQEGKELRLTPVKGKIFLYHVEQLRDDEPQMQQLAMRRDLSSFLGIPEVLPPIKIWRKPGKNLTQEQRESADQRRLDICHRNHTPIREYLMEQSTMTAEWILKYFLKSSDVYVTSPDRFRALIQAWKVDPCKSRVKV